MLIIIEKSLKDEVYLSIMARDVTYLHNFIRESIETGEDSSILIFMGGSVKEKHGGKYYQHGIEDVESNEPYIDLPLIHFLGEFFDHKEITKAIRPKELNKDEKRVLQEMKANNIKELKITFEKGRVIKVHITKHGVISGEQAEKIKQILGLKNYEKIELSTRDEKSLVFKKTKKK